MNWIKTEDELPDDYQLVICCDIYNEFITFGRYIEKENIFILMNMENVEIDSFPTHWMPTPDLPKDEQ